MNHGRKYTKKIPDINLSIGAWAIYTGFAQIRVWNAIYGTYYARVIYRAIYNRRIVTWIFNLGFACVPAFVLPFFPQQIAIGKWYTPRFVRAARTLTGGISSDARSSWPSPYEKIVAREPRLSAEIAATRLRNPARFIIVMVAALWECTEPSQIPKGHPLVIGRPPRANRIRNGSSNRPRCDFIDGHANNAHRARTLIAMRRQRWAIIDRELAGVRNSRIARRRYKLTGDCNRGKILFQLALESLRLT